MSRRTRAFWAAVLAVVMAVAGCKPIQPFYLGGHDDLAHYLGVATQLEYPDADVQSLTEVTMSEAPLTLSNPEPRELWDLSLEEAVHISLHNAKVLKSLGGLAANASFGGADARAGVFVAGASDTLRRSASIPDSLATVYNPAIQETNVQSPFTQGVESALAEFDAQLRSSFFWDRTHRPLNIRAIPQVEDIFPGIQRQNQANFVTELSKRTASGSQFFFRNNTLYEYSNSPSRALPSDWQTNFEMEARQPLLRGAGTQVNRVPVVLARIRTDISLSEFECNVRNHVFDTEKAYWELYFAYRNLEAAKAERDSVHSVWRMAEAELTQGAGTAQDEARARQQYFRTRARVEASLIELFKSENRLRYMLGLAPSDGRLIRPSDEPLNARVQFDWHEVLAESLCRSCELRIKRWQIKQREMELIRARNQVLPQMDAVALYRWLGRGDELLNDRDGPPFVNPHPDDPNFSPRGSDALEELFHGNYQEWRLGVEFALPVGFRRELAGIRNAQLQLARECALLKETELELIHNLSDAMQNADAWYKLSETNFNRRVAAENEVLSLQTAQEHGLNVIDLLLDALTRRADAQALFYRSLANYTVSISEIHFHKGSLLEFDNVLLAEGPWPSKAYCDAQQRARQRAAGHYLDYGFTRPRVISRGPVDQFQHGPPPAEGESMHDGLENGPATGEEIPPGELVPTPAPPLDLMGAAAAGASTAADAAAITGAAATLPVGGTSQVRQASAQAPLSPPIFAAAGAATAAAPQISSPPAKPASGEVEIRVKGTKFDWGPLGAKP